MKQLGKKTFAQKVRSGEHVILYEFLPPPKRLPNEDIDRSISLFTTIASKFHIDAINLPEVREETRHGLRTQPALVKVEPRRIAPYLRKYTNLEVIINRPIVYLPWSKQQQWLQETYRRYNIRNFVFVGGESRAISYPGLSVIETTHRVRNDLHSDFPDIFLGGIIIPERVGEKERVLGKLSAGIEFFTTQILYEAQAVKRLLKDLWKELRSKKSKPAMIFLSFTPLATKHDVELLRWLGVTVPKQTAENLQSGWIGMGWHSVQVCKEILEDILAFVHKAEIDIPLGLNIEHVSVHNLELSFILVEELSKVYFTQRRNLA